MVDEVKSFGEVEEDCRCGELLIFGPGPVFYDFDDGVHRVVAR